MGFNDQNDPLIGELAAINIKTERSLLLSNASHQTLAWQGSTTAPAGTERAAIVRNIPSGTQTVALNTKTGPIESSFVSDAILVPFVISPIYGQDPATEGTFHAATVDPSKGLHVKLQTTDLLPATLGQKPMATSLAVVIASDQSVIPAGGNIAHDAVDSGNPVKIGGKASNLTPTSVADSDRVNAHLDLKGNIGVFLNSKNDAPVTTGAPTADGISPAVLIMHFTGNLPFLFNGTNVDRIRSVGAGDAYSGTGLLAAQGYGFNGTTYDRLRTVAAGDAAATGLGAAGIYGFNGTTWDRARSTAEKVLKNAPHKLESADLSNVNTTYNDVTTSANSNDIDATGYRRFRLLWTLDYDGASSNATITFIVQVKDSDGTYFDMIDAAWGAFKFEDQGYVTAKNQAYSGNLDGATNIRVRVETTNTTATNVFIVSNMRLLLET